MWTREKPEPRKIGRHWCWWHGLDGTAVHIFEVINHPDGPKIWQGGAWVDAPDGFWWSEPVEPPVVEPVPERLACAHENTAETETDVWVCEDCGDHSYGAPFPADAERSAEIEAQADKVRWEYEQGFDAPEHNDPDDRGLDQND